MIISNAKVVTLKQIKQLCYDLAQDKYAGQLAPTMTDFDLARPKHWKSSGSLYCTETAWACRMYEWFGLAVAGEHRTSNLFLPTQEDIAEAEAAELPAGMPAILRGRTYRSDGVVEERYELR